MTPGTAHPGAHALLRPTPQHKVDLGLWGHVHVYERTCGITGNFTCAARDEDGVGA